MAVHESWWEKLTSVIYECGACGIHEEWEIVGSAALSDIQRKYDTWETEHRQRFYDHSPRLLFMSHGSIVPHSGNTRLMFTPLGLVSCYIEQPQPTLPTR